MLNKLILTRANPIADVVYGIDNALAGKALAAEVLAPYAGPAATAPSAASLPSPLVPVDFGYVTLNADKVWFAKKGLALPTTLQDLTLPAYKKPAGGAAPGHVQPRHGVFGIDRGRHGRRCRL